MCNRVKSCAKHTMMKGDCIALQGMLDDVPSITLTPSYKVKKGVGSIR